jgi:methylated-DNA-protein-cysteine methyltransferase-like protein
MSSPLFQSILEVVKRVPPGKVVSYSQVAKEVGLWRGARLVGWALGSLPPNTDIPWQRVINQKGYVSIKNLRFPKTLQCQILREEGVQITEKNGLLYVDPSAWYSFPKR